MNGKLLKHLALWSLLWAIVIGGTGAMFNYRDIRDDNRRAELARTGRRTIGTLSSGDKRAGMKNVRRCGRGMPPVVQFALAPKVLRRFCVDEGLPPEYGRYAIDRPLPDRRVGIVYDPDDSTRFFVTSPDGSVPRRHLDGIWRRWRKRTGWMLAVYCLGTAFFLWRKTRIVGV